MSYFGRFNPPEGMVVIFLAGMGIVVVVVLCFAFLTIMGTIDHVVLLRRQRRDAHPGPPTCATCGYDLRASRDRCPECGTPFETPVPPPPRLRLYRGFVLVSSRRGEQ